jgi:hypothetical protein
MKKRTIYIVIDLLHIEKTTAYRSISDVAGHVGVHRNTINLKERIIYGHHAVLERDV